MARIVSTAVNHMNQAITAPIASPGPLSLIEGRPICHAGAVTTISAYVSIILEQLTIRNVKIYLKIIILYLVKK